MAAAAGDTETRGTPDRTEEVRRLSHDVKNALHGASVNLEVVRSRAGRGATEPAQVVQFLESAAQQLEIAVRLHKELATLALALAGERAGSH